MKKNLIRIPVDSHGLHRNNFNFPSLLTMRFMETTPVFCKAYRKGEKINLNAGMLSRLNPLPQPAFCTGRYNFKAIFVPFKYVYKPWYYLDNGTEYLDSTGSLSIPAKASYTLARHFAYALGNCIVPLIKPAVDVNNPDLEIVSGPNPADRTQYDYTDAGCRVIKILHMLGYSPSMDLTDNQEINILKILCYIRAYLDYYFPASYVGNYQYNNIAARIKREVSFYDANEMCYILEALYYCSAVFYDNSLLDIAFDKPVSSNTGVPEPSILLNDVTSDSADKQIATNNPSLVSVPSDSTAKPSNGTPFVGSASSVSSQHYTAGVITQYVIDSLQKLNNYVQKHRLAGGRLLERFLVQRGIPIEKDYVEQSYFCGEHNLEINVDAVTNNSNTNLGELAGMGVAGTGKDKPLHFKMKAFDDGVFFVIAQCLADSNPVIYNDPFNYCVNQLDFYHSQFDKLGPDLIPSSVAYSSNIGSFNMQYIKGKGFGFHQRYYYPLMEQTRLAGDFRIHNRGSATLNEYHTFRMPDLASIQNNNGYYHGFSYLDSNVDGVQYQRIFYSANSDNLQLFIRWFGDEYLEKLPLGDSYDWNDDEYNNKVTVVSQGNR